MKYFSPIVWYSNQYDNEELTFVMSKFRPTPGIQIKNLQNIFLKYMSSTKNYKGLKFKKQIKYKNNLSHLDKTEM